MAAPDTANLLLPLQSLINRRIAASAAATELCEQLDSRILAMQIRDTSLTLYFTARGSTLELDTRFPGDADAIITGTPLGFASMAAPKDPNDRRTSGLKFEGDPEIGHRFQRLLALVQPDWEEELSRLLGDVAAHQIGNFFRAATAFGKQALTSLSENAAEYVQEESRDVVNRFEQQDFADEVAQVAAEVDAAAERLGAVEKARGTGDDDNGDEPETAP